MYEVFKSTDTVAWRLVAEPCVLAMLVPAKEVCTFIYEEGGIIENYKMVYFNFIDYYRHKYALHKAKLHTLRQGNG